MHQTSEAAPTTRHAFDIDTPIDFGRVLAFGPDVRLTCDDLEHASFGESRGFFTPGALSGMDEAATILAAAHDRGDSIYGLTTGFGPHVISEADADSVLQGCGLIEHLGAGWGAYASREVVRATLAARCQAVAQGRSGVAADAAKALLALLNHNVTPAIPEVGSVGASGDLIPLAHAAKVITGEGAVLCEDGAVITAQEALSEAGLVPVGLSARDALAMVNGTSFMTAFAGLACARAERLIDIAERSTAWLMRALGSRRQSLDPRLHELRGHVGQCASAGAILAYAGAYAEDDSRPLQEVYSVRCAPQVLGACRDQLDHARTIIEREINGVNDNPVITGTVEDPAVLHGGNFQGQQISFAADTINTAVVQAAMLIERQLDVLCNPELNTGAPLLLAHTPGATSGMAGGQITATAICADLRRSATPSACATIPTNGRNQDIVSMGTMAGRVAFEQTERASAVMAVQVIALHQLAHLRREGIAPGEAVEAQAGLPHVDGFNRDRALHADIARVSGALLKPERRLG